MKKSTLPLLFLILSNPILADIQITSRDQIGASSLLTSNGKTARMDGGGQPGYVLIDLGSGRMQMVDKQRRMVMQMPALSSFGVKPTSNRAGKLQLTDKGAGPGIAGYATRRFDIIADGQRCGSVYGSQQVMKLKGVKETFSALNKMQHQSRNMMGAFSGRQDACEQAELVLSDEFQRIGAPLRTVDARGQTRSEVTRINSGISKPAGFYAAPADYPITDMQQQMQAMQPQQQQMMQQMQNSMPDMQQMMRQMQQQGVPPEAMQQMQDMLKQQMQGR